MIMKYGMEKIVCARVATAEAKKVASARKWKFQFQHAHTTATSMVINVCARISSSSWSQECAPSAHPT